MVRTVLALCFSLGLLVYGGNVFAQMDHDTGGMSDSGEQVESQEMEHGDPGSMKSQEDSGEMEKQHGEEMDPSMGSDMDHGQPDDQNHNMDDSDGGYQ